MSSHPSADPLRNPSELTLATGTPPGRCPRREGPRESTIPVDPRGWVDFEAYAKEPFRLFFPAATLVGILGVMLWPVTLLGWMETYPGVTHARLMIQGFFGGFVFGFLGTAIPKLAGARPLDFSTVCPALGMFAAGQTAHLAGWTNWGDGIFLVELVFWVLVLWGRIRRGDDRPPPSFVLVAFGFILAVVGAGLQMWGSRSDYGDPIPLLGRLLGYHGFVLCCLLGAGGFLLPRFLGLGLRRRYPDSWKVSREWNRAAATAFLAGVVLVLSFGLEIFEQNEIAGALRAVVVTGYLAYEIPLERIRWSWRGVHGWLLIGLVCIPAGILAAGWFLHARVAWLHMELVGGFAMVTFGVASRVVLGHCGGRESLERIHPWLMAAAILMVIGLASRISGDVLPGIQKSHYIYGALSWIAGVVLWSFTVLRRVVRPDPEA